ncbi:MAG: DUF6311 domain-containing protein [Pseudomonadota bacterium]
MTLTELRAYPLVALLGAGLFALAFDTHILDPTNLGWLLRGGDWGQHVVGWIAFLNEPWSWPLGVIRSLDAPDGTSLVYVDALPLVSIPLKALLGVGAEPVQFQGWWFFSCVVLQGVVGFWCLSRMGVAPWPGVLGAVLLMLWAPMYQRLGHDTLVAHWIVLLGLGALFLEARARRAVLTGLALFAVCVHAYFVAMVALIALGSVWLRWREGGPRPAPWRRLAALGATVCAMLALMTLLGYFVINPDNTVTTDIRYFTMNLLSPVNSQLEGIWSQILSPLPILPGQYEGFAYLGVGTMGAVLAALVVTLVRPDLDPVLRRRFWALGGVALMALLYALSPRITLGESVLLDVWLPAFVERAASIFRGTGRFAWIVGLALVLWTVATLALRLPRRWSMAVLGLAVAVQAYDLSGAPVRLKALTAPDPTRQAEMEALAERWPETIDHAAFLARHNGPARLRYDISYAAVLNGASTNLFYVARRDHKSHQKRVRALTERILNGPLERGTLYLVPKIDPRACLMAARPEALLAREALVANGAWLEDATPLPPVWRDKTVLTDDQTSLADLIADCGEGCRMALGVRETNTPPPGVAAALTARGAERIATLGPRDAYLVVLENGRVIAEQSRPGRIAWEAPLGAWTLSVRSTGAGAGWGAGVSLDGIACSPDNPGYNGVLWREGDPVLRRFHRFPGR